MHQLLGVRTLLAFTIVKLLFDGALAQAAEPLPGAERHWAVATDVAVSADLFSPRPRGRFLGWVHRRFGPFEAAATLMLGGSAGDVHVFELGTAALGGYRLGKKRFSVLLAMRLGYLGIRVERIDGSLWTGALQLGPTFEARLRLGARFEVRAAPVDFTFYWNQIWIAAWEPRVGLSFAF